MAIVKIRKNWTKKIAAICDGVDVASFTSFELDAKPQPLEVELAGHVKHALDCREATMTFDKETRKAILLVPNSGSVEWTAGQFEW